MPKDTDKQPENEIFLLCTECAHKNEPERVYCHNCGVKLDRSKLPKPEETKNFEDPEEAKRRVNQMMNPHRGQSKRDVKILFQIIAFAAVLAAFVLFWLEPDNVPPAKSDTLPDRDAGELWTRAMDAKSAVSIMLTEFEINHHLGRVLKSTESAVPGIKFDRAFVRCQPGIITITCQRSVVDMPFYSSVSYHPVVKDGTFSPEVIGVRFGRLGIHPMAKIIGQLALDCVFKAFEKEGKHLSRLADVVVGEGTITFATKPQP